MKQANNISEQMADELWRKIESVQGHAFISEGLDAVPPERILNVVRASITNSKKSVKVLQAFLLKWERKLKKTENE